MSPYFASGWQTSCQNAGGENDTTRALLALVKLLKVLDRHSALLAEARQY
jgi:hypothetical protein